MSEAKSEVSVPLIVEEKEKVIGVQEGKRSILVQRLTYYWIVLVSQTLQIGFSTVAIVVAINEKTLKADNKEEIGRFAALALYSFISMMGLGVLLVAHYKKRPDTGPKKFTAVGHVNLARSCALTSILSLLLFFGPLALQYARGDGSNDIRTILVPLNSTLFFLSVGASSIAGWITYTAAKRARGAEQVPDPDYRVPAWTLATTSESQGLSAGNAVQLV